MMRKTCKCGDTVIMGSYFPACVKCEKCGTGLSYPGQPFDPPLDHDYVERFDSSTGEKYKVCRLCGEKEKK